MNDIYQSFETAIPKSTAHNADVIWPMYFQPPVLSRGLPLAPHAWSLGTGSTDNAVQNCTGHNRCFYACTEIVGTVRTHTCWQQQKHMTQCFLTSGFSLCWAGIAITNVLVLKLPLAFCVQTASAKLHQVWAWSLLTEWMQKVMSVSVPNWTTAYDIMAHTPWRVLLIQRGMLYGWGEGQWQRRQGHQLPRVHAYTATDK